jgi:hypothetical protein
MHVVACAACCVETPGMQQSRSHAATLNGGRSSATRASLWAMRAAACALRRAESFTSRTCCVLAVAILGRIFSWSGAESTAGGARTTEGLHSVAHERSGSRLRARGSGRHGGCGTLARRWGGECCGAPSGRTRSTSLGADGSSRIEATITSTFWLGPHGAGGARRVGSVHPGRKARRRSVAQIARRWSHPSTPFHTPRRVAWADAR